MNKMYQHWSTESLKQKIKYLEEDTEDFKEAIGL